MLTKQNVGYGVLLCGLAMATLVSPLFYEKFAINQAAILASKALSADPSQLIAAERALQSGGMPCRSHWLRGVVNNALGDYIARDAAWVNLLTCDPSFIPILRIFIPDHEGLARLAAGKRPDNAESWFWLASIAARESPDEAIRYYREGLRLDPRSGLRWMELGGLLKGHDPRGAMDAYLQACYYGDPGYNGCLSAGRTALEQGDVESAISYFSLSRWQPARDEANKLRGQRSENGRP